MTLCSWSFPPAMPALRNDEVHVWRALLDFVPEDFRSVDELSPDEIVRASRFIFDRDHFRFVSGRRILREILGKYLRRRSADIDFIYERHGKPRLHLSDSDPPIRFNLAHSGGLAVYAISLDREIGVDIEAVRNRRSTDEIVNQFSSQREMSEFRALSEDRLNEAFSLWWSRKEAYLKALGTGLSIPLNSFDVSLTPGAPAQLHSSDSTRWTLQSFRPHNAYAGALVVEGGHFELKFWDYTAAKDVGK